MGKSHVSKSVKSAGAVTKGGKGGNRDAHALARRLLHGQSRFKGARNSPLIPDPIDMFPNNCVYSNL